MQIILFAANSNPYQPLIVKIVMALVGLVLVGCGIYALKNKKLLVSRRQKFLLKMFGKEEITGIWATIGGAVQLLIGLAMLALPAVGPYFGLFGDSVKTVGSGRTSPPRPQRTISMPYEPRPPLESPATALPIVDSGGEDRNFLVLTTPVGFTHDGFDNFEHAVAPPGGVLIGIRACLRTSAPKTVLALKPVYQREDVYSMPDEPSGYPEGMEWEAIAEDGFVVSGAQIGSRGHVTGVKLRFHPLNDDGTLGPDDQAYWGSWMGDAGSPSDDGTIQFDGPAVGLSYRFDTNGENTLEKLAFAYVDPALKRLAQGTEVALPLVPEATAMSKVPAEVSTDEEDYRYRDQAPAGAMLVGLQCDKKESGAPFTLLRPIYAKGSEYVFGERWGPGGGTILEIAKPGYAVAGLKMPSLGRGIQLQYSKVQPSGQLDPNDTYDGEWIGDEGDAANLSSRLSPIVGFSFALKAGNIGSPIITVADLNAAPAPVEEIVATSIPEQSSPEAVAEVDTPPAANQQPAPIDDTREVVEEEPATRTWTSRSGKTVEAELIGIDRADRKLILRRASDGKEVKIPASAVSAEDQQFVRAWLKTQK